MNTGLLVTGGTGLVGFAMRNIYPQAVYLGSHDYDLTKEDDVKAMFERYKPEHVIHLAAMVGGIFENKERPAEFFYQNIMMNTLVIHYAYKYNVKKLIGLVSNCSYPDKVSDYPMNEEQLHDGPPALSNFAYGYAKRMLEVQIKSYKKQYNCNYFTVIPSSLYGPGDTFDERKGHFIPALIKKIHLAKINGQKVIQLAGSGKALRQYLYSEDLARILLVLMERYPDAGPVNICNNENLSIIEIARLALRVTGCEDIKLEFNCTASDGQLRKDIDGRRILAIIGDFQMTSLEDGIRKTYEWYIKEGR